MFAWESWWSLDVCDIRSSYDLRVFVKLPRSYAMLQSSFSVNLCFPWRLFQTVSFWLHCAMYQFQYFGCSSIVRSNYMGNILGVQVLSIYSSIYSSFINWIQFITISEVMVFCSGFVQSMGRSHCKQIDREKTWCKWDLLKKKYFAVLSPRIMSSS